MTSPQVGTQRYYPAAQSIPRIELGPICVISSVANHTPIGDVLINFFFASDQILLKNYMDSSRR